MGKKRWRRWRQKNKKSRALGILGRIGNEVGRAGEERALKACRNISMPEWWKGIRHATFEEDAFEKIDLVVSVDVGEIFIQIKSSLHKKWNQCVGRTSNNIPIIYIKLQESDIEIRTRILDIVSKERRKIMENKTTGR